jgi:transcriptional regulator with XRE-family HTH domain
MNQKAIGEFIAKLRKARGMTQQNLADKLHVSNKTVSKWERGVGIPEITTFVALAEIFNISVDDLINGQSQDKPLINKGPNQIKHLINNKVKHFEVITLLSRLGMIIGFILMLTIGYTTFRPILAGGIAITIYIISIGLLFFAKITLVNFINFDDALDRIQKQQLKYLNIKKTFYTFLLLSSLVILSLPILINAPTYGILTKVNYLNQLPYLLINIVIINVISHFIYHYILTRKGYHQTYRCKNYLYGILIIISFITPLITNHLFPKYIVSDALETLTYNNNSNEYHELRTWDDFYHNYYTTNQYEIITINKEKHYEYNNIILPVKKGEKYLPIFDNYISISKIDDNYKITYHPLTKAPISLDYYCSILLFQYLLGAVLYGIWKYTKPKHFNTY